MGFTPKASYEVEDLVGIVALLRSPGGCPWDREQTHESIRRNLIEETYEAAEAIDNGDAGLLCEELGDILLQIVLHARMEQEAGGFTFNDVCDTICKKLIHRHPHVFATTKVSGSAEVLANWDAIKRKEKSRNTAADTLRSVPRPLPALMRSQKVQAAAAKAGFDYPHAAMAMDDLRSELRELTDALENGSRQAVNEELGDLLFAAVNVSRFAEVDAEQALSGSCNKFIERFTRVEQLAQQRGIPLRAESAETLDLLWKEAKKESHR